MPLINTRALSRRGRASSGCRCGEHKGGGLDRREHAPAGPQQLPVVRVRMNSGASDRWRVTTRSACSAAPPPEFTVRRADQQTSARWHPPHRRRAQQLLCPHLLLQLLSHVAKVIDATYRCSSAADHNTPVGGRPGGAGQLYGVSRAEAVSQSSVPKNVPHGDLGFAQVS